MTGPGTRRVWATTLCRTCGLSRDQHGYRGAYHPWDPVAVPDMPFLAGMTEAIESTYRFARGLDYPAAKLLEATSFHTGIPKPLLEIAFAHEEANATRRELGRRASAVAVDVRPAWQPYPDGDG